MSAINLQGRGAADDGGSDEPLTWLPPRVHGSTVSRGLQMLHRECLVKFERGPQAMEGREDQKERCHSTNTSDFNCGDRWLGEKG